MESSKEAVWTWSGNYKLHLEGKALTADGRFPVRRCKPEEGCVHAQNGIEGA